MQFKSETARAEVVTDLKNAIAAHAAALNDDTVILAWDNGLGVAFTVIGSNPFVTNLLRAEPVQEGLPPVIRNGNGEVAKPVRRSTAIAHYLPTLCELLTVALED